MKRLGRWSRIVEVRKMELDRGKYEQSSEESGRRLGVQLRAMLAGCSVPPVKGSRPETSPPKLLPGESYEGPSGKGWPTQKGPIRPTPHLQLICSSIHKPQNLSSTGWRGKTIFCATSWAWES